MHAPTWRGIRGLGRQAKAGLPRPLRFATIGAVCGGLQLVCLAALVQLGLRHAAANLIALTLSTQANFVCSATVIWPDRPTSLHLRREFVRRLVAFNMMCAGTLLINEAVFAVSERFVPYLIAGALGIALAAPLNYAISHYGIFRQARVVHLNLLPAAASAAEPARSQRLHEAALMNEPTQGAA